MDLSKIDRLEIRQAVKALEAVRAERERAMEAEMQPVCDEYAATIRATEARHRAELSAARVPFEERLAEIAARHPEDDIAALDAAYGDEARMMDDDWDPMTCAATGLPILEGDEIVTDEETGEVFLRAALGLPPREVRPPSGLPSMPPEQACEVPQ